MRTGETRPMTIEDHHARIDYIRLNSAVPQPIKNRFTTSCNLLLYSWFVYEFLQVAELYAFASLEYALKERISLEKVEKPTRGIKHRLNYAIEQGWLKDDEFPLIRKRRENKEHEDFRRKVYPSETFEVEPPDPQNYVKLLAETISDYRNEIAHGSSSLHHDAYGTLETRANIINQLFPD